MDNEQKNIVQAVEDYLKKYVTFSQEYFALPAALWAIGTHCFYEFDVFPYLTIGAKTKRAGKSTLKNLLMSVSRNGKSFSIDSPSSMFRSLEINPDKGEAQASDYPDMFIEEAEKLHRDNHPAREFLNKGYEKGDKITKTLGEVKEFDCFCPKCFVLIGSVFDTLNDRSIPILMRRRTPVEASKAVRVRMHEKQAEAAELKSAISRAVKDNIEAIRIHYSKFEQLSFLNERDELLFQPLFTLLSIFAPERTEEFTKIAVDVSMEKQAPATQSTGDDWEAAERAADDEEYRIILLRDMLKLADNYDYIPSNDIVQMLYDIPTSPWRKFRGRGLDTRDMGFLLDVLSVHPVVIRKPGTSGNKGKRAKGNTFRGYRTEHLKAAAKLSGLIE